MTKIQQDAICIKRWEEVANTYCTVEMLACDLERIIRDLKKKVGEYEDFKDNATNFKDLPALRFAMTDLSEIDNFAKAIVSTMNAFRDEISGA